MEGKARLQDRLKEALADAGMKPIELSERTGIPKSMISYYLNGKTKPKADRIYTISVALDVNEAWLIGYDAPKERPQKNTKNDTLIGVVSKMRKDPEFFDVVSLLAELPPEEYASVKTLLTALSKK